VAANNGRKPVTNTRAFFCFQAMWNAFESLDSLEASVVVRTFVALTSIVSVCVHAR